MNLCINKRIKPCCFNWPICLLKTIVVKSVNNLIVCKEDIMKLYNRDERADLPVFTPLKTVKNPGTYM